MGTDPGGAAGNLAYTLTTPDSWVELDLQPATRERSIREAVERRTREVPELWEQRHAIRKLFIAEAERAHRSGAVACSSFTMPTDAGPVTGAMTVSLVADPGAGREDLRAELGFRERPRTDDPLAPYAVTSVVELADGLSCPRSAGIEDVALDGGHYLRQVFMTTAVPVPRFRSVFLIAASSPSLPLADALIDVFDAVSSSFRVVELPPRTTTDLPSSTKES